MDPAFLRIVDDVKALLKYVWNTENSFTIPVSGTGSAAWEAAVANLTVAGDVHLICSNGYFGERAVDLHGRYTDQVRCVSKSSGEVFSPAEVEAAVREHRPALLWMCHAE